MRFLEVPDCRLGLRLYLRISITFWDAKFESGNTDWSIGVDIASGPLIGQFQDGASDRQELSDSDLNTLSGSQLFTGVARQRLREWMKPRGEVRLRAGAVLLETGQHSKAIYSLVSGRLAIFLDEDDKIPVAYVMPGECVGEISLLDGRDLPHPVGRMNRHIAHFERLGFRGCAPASYRRLVTCYSRHGCS